MTKKNSSLSIILDRENRLIMTKTTEQPAGNTITTTKTEFVISEKGIHRVRVTLNWSRPSVPWYFTFYVKQLEDIECQKYYKTKLEECFFFNSEKISLHKSVYTPFMELAKTKVQEFITEKKREKQSELASWKLGYKYLEPILQENPNNSKLVILKSAINEIVNDHLWEQNNLKFTLSYLESKPRELYVSVNQLVSTAWGTLGITTHSVSRVFTIQEHQVMGLTAESFDIRPSKIENFLKFLSTTYDWNLVYHASA